MRCLASSCKWDQEAPDPSPTGRLGQARAFVQHLKTQTTLPAKMEGNQSTVQVMPANHQKTGTASWAAGPWDCWKQCSCHLVHQLSLCYSRCIGLKQLEGQATTTTGHKWGWEARVQVELLVKEERQICFRRLLTLPFLSRVFWLLCWRKCQMGLNSGKSWHLGGRWAWQPANLSDVVFVFWGWSSGAFKALSCTQTSGIFS